MAAAAARMTAGKLRGKDHRPRGQIHDWRGIRYCRYHAICGRRTLHLYLWRRLASLQRGQTKVVHEAVRAHPTGSIRRFRPRGFDESLVQENLAVARRQ